MTTYATMRNAIIDEMANDGALTNAQVNNAILRSIRHYERRPWWWNQKTATFSTVAAQEYYTSAALTDIPDIVDIKSATITVDGVKSVLTPVNFEDMDAQQDGNVTGDPVSYTLFKENIRLYPIPTATRTVTLAYIYRLTELSADSDSNAWMTDAEELIRQAAKKRVALDIFQADDIAARAGIMEKMAFDELEAENRRRRPQKLLTVPGMLATDSFNINRGW